LKIKDLHDGRLPVLSNVHNFGPGLKVKKPRGSETTRFSYGGLEDGVFLIRIQASRSKFNTKKGKIKKDFV
jgi:hypothetical protein